MTTQTPVAASTATQNPAIDAYDEVDLTSGLSAIARRWWVVLICVIAGAAIGMLAAGGSSATWEANSTVYVGQPVSPNGALLNTISAKAATAIEIARGDESLAAAATAAGVSPQRIRNGLVVTAVQSPLASKLQSPPALMKVTVRDRNEDVAQQASEAIADHLVTATNTYVPAKIKQLRSQMADYQQLIRDLSAQQRALLSGGGADETRAILASMAGRDINAARASLAQAEGELGLAKEIELSRVLTKPHAIRITTSARRPTVAMGALLGLLVGLPVAWASGRRRTTA